MVLLLVLQLAACPSAKQQSLRIFNTIVAFPINLNPIAPIPVGYGTIGVPWPTKTNRLDKTGCGNVTIVA